MRGVPLSITNEGILRRKRTAEMLEDVEKRTRPDAWLAIMKETGDKSVRTAFVEACEHAKAFMRHAAEFSVRPWFAEEEFEMAQAEEYYRKFEEVAGKWLPK